MDEEPHCNMCDASAKALIVKEKMFGMDESFTYLLCTECCHLHLPNAPFYMDKYYPVDKYYSFKKQGAVKKALVKFLPSAAIKSLLKQQISKSATVLDYGCGGGQLVNELHFRGYKEVYGYDPYLPAEMCDRALTRSISNVPLWYKKWDVITLNHVIEHIDKPITLLAELHKMLNENGALIIRTPVIDSAAFEIYRQNWVQLDAPRHINIFTRASLIKAVDEKYSIKSLYDDSNHFQFTGSELYKTGKNLNDNNSFLKRILSPQTYYYSLLAKKLNRRQCGDQVVMILKKKINNHGTD